MPYNRKTQNQNYRKPEPAAPAPRVYREWSPLQTAVFEAMDQAVSEKNGQNLTVLARAGSGKTSTIVEAIHRLPPGVRALAVAFNKTIAVELQEKVPAPHEASTLHSAGFKIIRKHYPSIRLDKEKAYTHAELVLTREGRIDPRTRKPLRAEVSKIAKASQLTRETLTAPDDLPDLVQRFDLNRNGEDFPIEDFCRAVLATIASMIEDTRTLDFSDMVFLPVHHKWTLPIYDLVIVDEAQDMNKAQLVLATYLVKPEGSIVIVGDDMQAIYGFRGADSQAIQRMTEELHSQVLPLSVSYRCPRLVVEQARKVCPDITPSPEAPEGEILNIAHQNLVSMVAPGDFVLSRTNAPLASICLTLLAKGVPAIIAGRDVGAKLVSTVERSKARTIKSFLVWISEYQEQELEKIAALRWRTDEAREEKEQELLDLTDCLIALTEGLAPEDLISRLTDRIEALFSDEDPKFKVVCSTVHKAKGRERPRVFMLDRTFQQGKGKPEEDRIWYVAVTRAQRTLVHVQP